MTSSRRALNPLEAAQAVRQGGLRGQVTRLVIVVIAALVVVHGAVSLSLYAGALDEQLRFKGDAFATALAGDAQLRVSVWAGYERGIHEQLQSALARQPALLFVAVIDNDTPGGRVLGYAGPDKYRDVANKPAIDGVLLRSAILEESAPAASAPAAGDGDDLGLLEPGAAPSATAGNAAKKRVSVVAALDRAPITTSTLRHALVTLLLGVVAVLVALTLVSRVFAGMFRRIRHVSDAASVIASGDLRAAEENGATGGQDELGAFAHAVDEIRVRWTAIVGDIRRVSDEVVRSTQDIASEARHVADGSSAQVDASTATAKRSAAIVADARGLQQIVDDMARIGRESGQSLTRARDASTVVTAEMDRVLESLQENDRHRADLTKTASDIQAALMQLSQAVRAAVSHADDVAGGMEDAAQRSTAIADHARAAVERSGAALALLEKQRDNADAVARGANETTSALSVLQDAMGDVLNMTATIRDIADLTSMLSLNASIIAAQAGDRALGFGTVAEEIRALAARTRKAVDGIDIRADDARKHLATMDGVVAGLSSTVDLSRATTEETNAVIQQVLEQMNGALEQVADLAGLIREASRSTTTSRDAVNLIDNEVRSIGTALDAQRDAQRRLEQSAGAMGKNIGNVRDTGREQVSTTAALIESMTRLTRRTDELVALCAQQAQSAAAIAGDTKRVREVAERHRETVGAITGAVTRLDDQARALRETIGSLLIEDRQ